MIDTSRFFRTVILFVALITSLEKLYAHEGWFPQYTVYETSDSLDNSGTESHPKFNIYTGLAWSRGFGLGVRILPIKNWSFDAFYGANPRLAFLFFGISDPEIRYSFGTNFHIPHLSPWTISLSVTGVTSPQTVVPNENLLNYLIVALDFGTLSWEKKGFVFYAKGGIGQPIHKHLSNNSNPYELGNLFLNFDVGLGWNFW